MSLKIVLSTFLLLVAVSLPFVSALTCYTCEYTGKSTEEDGCISMKNLQPTTCSHQVLTRLAGNQGFPQEIRRIFEIDMLPNTVQNSDWTCAKLEIGGMNGKNNYTIRTCQIAKPDMANFCETATNKLRMNTNNNYPSFTVQHCSECKSDACNGASSIAVSFPILAIFVLASYYFKA